MHAADCKDYETKPEPGQFIFAVKNTATREYRHVVAESSAAAIAKTGWTEIAYTLITRVPSTPMPEAVKARLIEINKERRSVRRKGPNDDAQKTA